MMNWDPDEDRYCKLIMTIITIIIYLPWTYYLIWLPDIIPKSKMQLRHLHVECAQFSFSLSEHVGGMMWFGLSGCCCIWPTKTWCPSCRDVRRAFVGRASVRKWVEKSMNNCFTWWIDESIDYNRYTIHVSFLDLFWTQVFLVEYVVYWVSEVVMKHLSAVDDHKSSFVMGCCA